jgi:hypothetical protein
MVLVFRGTLLSITADCIELQALTRSEKSGGDEYERFESGLNVFNINKSETAKRLKIN